MNFLIQLIIGIVLTIAGTLFEQAFGQKDKQQTGRRGAVQIGGKVPQSFLVGTIGVAGKHEYRGTWGSSGEVPNAYLTDVFSFGDLPIDGINRVFVKGVDCGAGEGGAVAQGVPFPAYKLGDSGLMGGAKDHLWRIFRDGTETTASSFLVDKFGNDSDRPWLADMIGRGVPHLILTALWNEQAWAGFPEYMVECRGIRLYDPRKDTTAGGSGPQRWDSPATWAWTDNSAVIIYNIERGIWYEGQHVWGGKKTAAQLPYAVWAAAMDECDRQIALRGGGSERQFRAGREIFLDERPADIIRELLIGACARIHHGSDGTVHILVGVPDTVDGTFGTADVLGTEPIGSIPFPDLDQTINGATATYLEPVQAWGDKETAPYYRSDLEAQDDGQRNTEGLDLGTTFSGTQAQRVLKATVEEARRFRKHVVALRPPFAKFRPLQVLAWTDPERGYAAKRFLITARTVSPWGWVVFGLQEIDPADHVWTPSTDERPLSFAPITLNRPVPQPVSGFYVEPAIAEDSEGRPRRPAIDAFWSSASVSADVMAVRITVRLDEGDQIVWEGQAPRPELGSARLAEALLPDQGYEVQIQYIAKSGRATLASSWLAVTTPDVRFGPLDVYGLDIANLNESLNNSIEALFGTLREVLRQGQELATDAADETLANYSQHQQIRREIRLTEANVTASYLEAITVAVGPGSAIASRIEALEVKVDNDLAEIVDLVQAELGPDGALATSINALSTRVDGVESNVTVRGVSQSGPGGGWAAWGVQVRIGTGDDWSEGVFAIETNGSQSRAVFDVDQFILRSGSNREAPFIFEEGEAKMTAARIGTIKAGILQGNAVTINLNTGFFSFG